MTRRTFIATTGLAAAGTPAHASGTPAPHIATNAYPWMTFYKRTKRDWSANVDAGLAEVAQSGIKGYEPIGNSPAEVTQLGTLLKRHGLEMRSLYVNSTLHEEAQAEKSIGDVLAIAAEAKKLGTRIIVTNPSPIKWGGAENKSDAQLKVQAGALEKLGGGLVNMGMCLAYHNHDIELRNGAREFHHMLTATDPEMVRFCLDAHWVFRGCGDSQVALFDAVAHYHERIVELHLRQSIGGVWTEQFSMAGDIDYQRLFDLLAGWKNTPHLVLEQAVEARSPDTMTAVEAHAASCRNLLGAAS